METIIISVGGSLVVPDEIDVKWLSSFKNLIEKYAKKGFRFIIISGGGKTARNYQNAIRSLSQLKSDDLDWIGIHATRLNAHLLRTIFKKHAYSKVIKDPTQKITTKAKIIIAAGWKPGCSTDYDAVLLAKNLRIKKIVNLSNIDYVYDKDPKLFNDAKPIKSINWKGFRKIVGNKWDPGLNVPFDPIASKLAEKLKMEVLIMNGKKIKDIENYFCGKHASGTLVK